MEGNGEQTPDLRALREKVAEALEIIDGLIAITGE